MQIAYFLENFLGGNYTPPHGRRPSPPPPPPLLFFCFLGSCHQPACRPVVCGVSSYEYEKEYYAIMFHLLYFLFNRGERSVVKNKCDNRGRLIVCTVFVDIFVKNVTEVNPVCTFALYINWFFFEPPLLAFFLFLPNFYGFYIIKIKYLYTMGSTSVFEF